MTRLWFSSKFAQLYKLNLCNKIYIQSFFTLSGNIPTLHAILNNTSREGWSIRRASEANVILLVIVQWKTRYV